MKCKLIHLPLFSLNCPNSMLISQRVFLTKMLAKIGRNNKGTSWKLWIPFSCACYSEMKMNILGFCSMRFALFLFHDIADDLGKLQRGCQERIGEDSISLPQPKQCDTVVPGAHFCSNKFSSLGTVVGRKKTLLLC